MIKEIPRPISGGLILSYKCCAACQHCIYACSPHWDADWISYGDLMKIMAGLAKYIETSPHGPDRVTLNHGLHFTGGEPFLNFKLLCRAQELAREFNIPSTFVETNCFWAIDDETTREKLLTLEEMGLKGIMISVNPFYLEYVPFERTQRAARIASEIFGPNMMIYQMEYFLKFLSGGLRGKMSYDEYLLLERNFARNTEFFIMGRAAYRMEDRLKETFPRYRTKLLFCEPCMPTFLRDWHNHFDNYGNYVPGFCAGITLGDCTDLDALMEMGIDTDEHPILSHLIDDDLKGLLKLARGYGYKEIEGGYLSKCHLCTDIRMHLAHEGDFSELRPKQFYWHLGRSSSEEKKR